MSGSDYPIEIIGLTRTFHAPAPSSPRTREKVPSGYGTREQCLPFVEASRLGLTIPSPFAWGYCKPVDVPVGTRSFRSPVSGGCSERVFYVRDSAEHGFARNQFAVPEEILRLTGPIVIPGLSFFNREDQQDLVKLHLPYIFRTSEEIGLLFTAPLNRTYANGANIMSGLVETGWYADAVNLALQLPDLPSDVHIEAGDPIAQVFPVPMSATNARPVFPENHRRSVRNTLSAVAEWRTRHDADRSAYKKISKNRD